jgi:leader peptidase (prepilin peptidase) / N-methyltransferase
VPGAVGVLGYAGATGGWQRACMGAAFLTVIYLAVHLIGRDTLGAGDVKLAMGLGAAAGLGGTATWTLAAVTAPILTVIIGLVVPAIRRSRHVRLPHGPSMCAATLVALAVAG